MRECLLGTMSDAVGPRLCGADASRRRGVTGSKGLAPTVNEPSRSRQSMAWKRGWAISQIPELDE
jgi:hypothetical protein